MFGALLSQSKHTFTIRHGLHTFYNINIAFQQFDRQPAFWIMT